MAYSQDNHFAEEINRELVAMRRAAGWVIPDPPKRALPKPLVLIRQPKPPSLPRPKPAPTLIDCLHRPVIAPEKYAWGFMKVCVYRSNGRDVPRSAVPVLLGYTVGDLVAHIEKNLESWMTWGNRFGENGWVLDHIRPLCSFNISSLFDQEFRDAHGLMNLRPLSWMANAKKGGRWIPT